MCLYCGMYIAYPALSAVLMSVMDVRALVMNMNVAGSMQFSWSIFPWIYAWTRPSYETWWSIFHVEILVRRA